MKKIILVIMMAVLLLPLSNAMIISTAGSKILTKETKHCMTGVKTLCKHDFERTETIEKKAIMYKSLDTKKRNDFCEQLQLVNQRYFREAKISQKDFKINRHEIQRNCIKQNTQK